MDQSVGFSVLVVDNDDRSLANLVRILIDLKYKVLIANSAHNALETLREFEGFFDLIITELHLPGMDGFEFQKCIKDEFQLPIIMMSKDNRKDIISKSLENGVALYVLKPFCENDFKDIWKYASNSCNEKLILAKDLRNSEGESTSENDVIQDETESNRKYCKRKTLDEDKNDGRFQILKKPKVYWNTHLHNLFMLAIKQIGDEKVVPKRILEVMNIPQLTRENVASHLQKYRLFLKKVAEKGMVEGLSYRALRSKFAESLPISMIHDMQQIYEKQHDPSQQRYSCYINPFNKAPTSLIDQKVSTNSSYATTHHGRSQFSYYDKLLNQVLQEKSSLGSNIGNNNVHQNNNVANRDMLSTYGRGHGLMTSQKCLSEGLKLKYGDSLYQNYGSLGTHNLSYGLGNCNMGSLRNSNVLPQTSVYHPNNIFSGNQINDGSLTVPSANNNSSGFINGFQNENINLTSLGLVSNVGGGSESELSATLITAGNHFGVMEIPQQKLVDDVVGNEQQLINASSTSDQSEVNLMKEDPSELFLMLDDMGLFNNLMEQNNLTASEFSNFEFSHSSNNVQPLCQFDGVEDVTVLPTNITSNLTNVSPTNSEQNSTQVQDNDIFAKGDLDDKFMGDIIGSSNTSAFELDLDIEKIEALFGTIDD